MSRKPADIETPLIDCDEPQPQARVLDWRRRANEWGLGSVQATPKLRVRSSLLTRLRAST